MHKTIKPVAFALATSLTLQGCATTAANGERKDIKAIIKETFNSDDPCSNSKRNIGIALGAAGGILVGFLTGDKNNIQRALFGGVIGAGLGGLIGHEIDNRQCEISKIQKKYNAEIQMTPMVLPVDKPDDASTKQVKPQATKANAANQEIGLSVAVVDQAGATQFESDSDTLQPAAREMFLEIANTYTSPKKKFEANTDEDKQALEKAFNERRILLVGHTDDTGSSQGNANLSERRAKAIAKLFKEAGVPEDKIFYQGAGETMPIADNQTAEGRAKNRRVEIVDLNNEQVFDIYLAHRRANASFYRASTEPPAPAKSSTMVAEASKPTQQSTQKTKPTKNKPKNVKAPTGDQADKPNQVAEKSNPVAEKSNQVAANQRWFDFDGKPFSPALALVNTGVVKPPKNASFSLISEAQASDMQAIHTCNLDRPRIAGAIKSFKDGGAYKTAEYLPGMYGRTWATMVGKNLVVLNHVSVLREGLVPGNKPELKVYANYQSSAKAKTPDLLANPEVNAYQTSNGLLYRLFANGDRGIQCMDILFPTAYVSEAKEGKLIYQKGAAQYVANYKPKMLDKN